VEEEKQKKPDIKDVLNSFTDHTSASLFNNDKYVGIEFSASRKGWGFGSITLVHDLARGGWYLDDECTSKERVIEILQAGIPMLVEALYDKGLAKFEWVDCPCEDKKPIRMRGMSDCPYCEGLGRVKKATYEER